MKKLFAKIIRVITIPPVFAALLCTVLYFQKGHVFLSLGHYLAALGFLSVLPVLSYPLCAAIPALRRGGHRTERTLGLIFSVVGYLAGLAFALLTDSTPDEKLIYTTYVISGLALAICTLAHFKASAHTCGCSGPIIFLSVLVSPWFLLGYLLLAAVMWASKNLERHSPAQMIGGSVIPLVALLLSMRLVF